MRFRIYIALITIASLGLGCVDVRTGAPSELHPRWMSFGGEGRIAYELSGPDFDDEHRPVSDVVWRPGVYATESEGVLNARWDQPAPYRAGSLMKLEVPFIRHGGEPDTLMVDATVRLRSVTSGQLLEEFPLRASLDFTDSEDRDGATRSTTEALTIEIPLPPRVDLYELSFDWTLNDGEIETRALTTHQVPTSLYGPLEGVPVYRETAVWGAKWLGELAADTSEHEVAWALTRGIRSLERSGYSYGTFDRPDSDEIVTKADVFIDHRRSACGEFRGLLMALLEFHGVDAKWVWFKFEDEPTDPDAAPFRAYRTRPIAAVGRERKRWFSTNHSIVGVGDRVYDPTYTVWKDSWQEYEDWMFEAYCWGEGDEPDASTCVDNPPGYDVRTLGFNRYVSDSLK